MWGNIGVFIPIVAIAATAWVIAAILRYKSQVRHPGEAAGPAEIEENVRLVRENEELRHVIGRLEQRLQVLERIATDPAERTARDIESLR
jgi:hypothetical protein